MKDGIDAMTVMLYNEYDQIINCGLNENELNTFQAAKYGFDVPEDGLYCLKSTYANKKPELKKFLQATLKGWTYAANNKDYTIDVVLKRMQQAHVPANKVHQEWMLNKVLELIRPGNKGVKMGDLKETDFLKAVDILYSRNKVKPKYTFTDFYQPLSK
jgi:NitT/TauT family transport system substrate-binding protein